jgi:hypothetical protein
MLHLIVGYFHMSSRKGMAMKKTGVLGMILAVLAGSQPGHAWETPQRGSALRTDLMDAVRPHAEWLVGAPVEFVVDSLRVEGDVAFGSLYAVRPGGQEITRDEVPERLGYDNPLDWGGTDMQILYQRSGTTWVAVHHLMGATDVWWSDPQFCPQWRSVISEMC